MLDYRIYTFLQLCKTMNYRKTAELLHMTQPAVTQHIQFLEREYGCALFEYSGKKLTKTKEAGLLERYARTVCYNEQALRNQILEPPFTELRIGATKTIGEFLIKDQVKKYLQKERRTLTLLVDNTELLLSKLEQNEMDFLMVEGFFDKNKYGYRSFCQEPFIGICPENHPFADREVSREELFQETILVREKGSGTRAVLEQLLLEKNDSLACFQKQICISSFPLIKELVFEGYGISFVYKAVAESDKRLHTFRIKGEDVQREFHYVYLKETEAEGWIAEFMD